MVLLSFFVTSLGAELNLSTTPASASGAARAHGDTQRYLPVLAETRGKVCTFLQSASRIWRTYVCAGTPDICPDTLGNELALETEIRRFKQIEAIDAPAGFLWLVWSILLADTVFYFLSLLFRGLSQNRGNGGSREMRRIVSRRWSGTNPTQAPGCVRFAESTAVNLPSRSASVRQCLVASSEARAPEPLGAGSCGQWSGSPTPVGATAASLREQMRLLQEKQALAGHGSTAFVERVKLQRRINSLRAQLEEIEEIRLNGDKDKFEGESGKVTRPGLTGLVGEPDKLVSKDLWHQVIGRLRDRLLVFALSSVLKTALCYGFLLAIMASARAYGDDSSDGAVLLLPTHFFWPVLPRQGHSTRYGFGFLLSYLTARLALDKLYYHLQTAGSMVHRFFVRGGAQ